MASPIDFQGATRLRQHFLRGDRLRKESGFPGPGGKKRVVIVISPLKALEADQVSGSQLFY